MYMYMYMYVQISIAFPCCLQKKDLVLSAKPTSTPTELVNAIFSHPDIRKAFRMFRPVDFRLKVQGKEEYLLEDVPLYRFKVSSALPVSRFEKVLNE